MKQIIEQLNKSFDNRIRLAVMSALMVNDSLDFNSLKDLLSVTDGNLASHMNVLQKKLYISVKKEFRGRKPVTRYSATAKGRRAFGEHLDALEELIRKSA